MRDLNTRIVASWAAGAFVVLVLLVSAAFERVSLGEAFAIAAAGLILILLGVMAGRSLVATEYNRKLEQLNRRVSEIEQALKQ